MFDVIVVGAGLFGSVTAMALRREGRKVLVIDDKRPDSGSVPAACLMRPSWLSKLGKDVYNPALALLDRQYGLQDIKFQTLVGPVNVHWIPPQQILRSPDRIAKVLRVTAGSRPWVVVKDGESIFAKKVVVAAGIWSSLLAQIDGKFFGQAGMACLWPGEEIKKPFIQVWAPYKQVTAFNRGDGLWAGDSNAIRWDNWTEKYATQTVHRCREAVNLGATPTRLFGVRPYSSESPCYLKEAGPNVWVATGGAKNGTVAAAWCAHQLVKRL